jgi:hypothetical protein
MPRDARMPTETMMRFYNQQHRYYCGIDLHARSMFIHILDAQGQTRFEQDRHWPRMKHGINTDENQNTIRLNSALVLPKLMSKPTLIP